MNVRYFIKAIGYTAVAANRERKLFRSDRIDIDAATSAIEADASVHQREDRVIASEADVLAGKKLRAALPNDNISREHGLAAESFYAKPFADAVAAVLNATL